MTYEHAAAIRTISLFGCVAIAAAVIFIAAPAHAQVREATDAELEALRCRGVPQQELAGGVVDDSLLQTAGIPENPSASNDWCLFLQERNTNAPSHVSGFDAEFGQCLARFFGAAEQAGHRLTVYSGTRSPEHQARLFTEAVAKHGSVSAARQWVAPPPCSAGADSPACGNGSNHNRGLAADLRFNGTSCGDAETACNWVHQNASQFGLVFRLNNEPWHIEPTGGGSCISDGRGRGGSGDETPGGTPTQTASRTQMQAACMSGNQSACMQLGQGAGGLGGMQQQPQQTLGTALGQILGQLFTGGIGSGNQEQQGSGEQQGQDGLLQTEGEEGGDMYEELQNIAEGSTSTPWSEERERCEAQYDAVTDEVEEDSELVCTQQVESMVCGLDRTYQRQAGNGCVIERLEELGWERESDLTDAERERIEELGDSRSTVGGENNIDDNGSGGFGGAGSSWNTPFGQYGSTFSEFGSDASVGAQREQGLWAALRSLWQRLTGALGGDRP